MENILSGNPLLNYSSAGQKNDMKVIFYIFIAWRLLVYLFVSIYVSSLVSPLPLEFYYTTVSGILHYNTITLDSITLHLAVFFL